MARVLGKTATCKNVLLMKGSTARQLHDDAKACTDPAKRTKLLPALDRHLKELDEKEQRLQAK